jgi:hypothetical protein
MLRYSNPRLMSSIVPRLSQIELVPERSLKDRRFNNALPHAQSTQREHPSSASIRATSDLPQNQMPDLLREVFRVMAPGGTARFVVPDIRKLVAAYINGDTAFFDAKKEYYPVSDGFLDGGVTNLDYILFFCGAAHQVLNYHHKFGYDTHTLCRHLRSAGFSEVMASGFQESAYAELRVDDQSYNSVAADDQGNHFSLFVEVTK